MAGYQHLDKLGSVDAEGLRKHFEINSIAPILIAQSLRPNLISGSKVCLSRSDKTCPKRRPVRRCLPSCTVACATPHAPLPKRCPAEAQLPAALLLADKRGAESAQVVFISSKMGSCGDGRTGGNLVSSPGFQSPGIPLLLMLACQIDTSLTS